MEALSAEVARKEILGISKRSTEVAHLYENQPRIIKAYLDWIRIPVSVPVLIVSKLFH